MEGPAPSGAGRPCDLQDADRFQPAVRHLLTDALRDLRRVALHELHARAGTTSRRLPRNSCPKACGRQLGHRAATRCLR